MNSLWMLCFIVILGMAVIYASMAIPYHKSTYYRDTHKLFFFLIMDKGAYGEYLTYKCLKSYEQKGAKFLFNCYLPAKEGETSEIDVMMIHSSGIYVFESKNYSGWIFGSENQKTWTQSLPQGRGRRSRKEKFYNPIMQNRTHIKWLQGQIGMTKPIRNIVVFSERCELKKVEVTSNDVTVIKRNALPNTVRKMEKERIPLITRERIQEIYELLYPFTQVNLAIKESHVRDIEEKYKFK